MQVNPGFLKCGLEFYYGYLDRQAPLILGVAFRNDEKGKELYKLIKTPLREKCVEIWKRKSSGFPNDTEVLNAVMDISLEQLVQH